MAATQYQVFCRYLNENVNKIVSNTSTAEWVSAEEWYQCKVAYNVTNASQANAMLITQDSINTNVKKESTYKALYDALVSTMNIVRANGSRLRYTEFSAEEKRVYDLCHRYEEIIKGVGEGKIVIEYAMIRPLDQMVYTSSGDSRKDQSIELRLRKALRKMDSELYEVVYDQLKVSNEKYNMLFTYNGIAQTDEQTDYYQVGNTFEEQKSLGIGNPPIEALNPYDPGKENQKSAAQMLITVDVVASAVYERMERLKMDPWFLIATCNSLKAAMTKAEALVDIYGQDAVKIGKVVPIDQYIEIV